MLFQTCVIYLFIYFNLLYILQKKQVFCLYNVSGVQCCFDPNVFQNVVFIINLLFITLAITLTHFIPLKGIVHPKWNFAINLLTLKPSK